MSSAPLLAPPEHTCAPHSLLRGVAPGSCASPAPPPPASPAAVVLSYALRGSPFAVRSVLSNALAFTQTASILVHFHPDVCQPASACAARHAQPLNASAGRLHFNSRQIRVEKHTASILMAHLLNFELCERPTLPCARADARFVLMSANSVLVRLGVEAWVSRRRASFCLGHGCTDLTLHAPAARHERLARDAAHLRWAASAARLRAAAAARNDSSVAGEAWFSRFFELMRRQPPREWQPRPLNYFAHEGSFYPAWLLRQLVRCLRGTPFEQALLSCEPCACCTVYPSLQPAAKLATGFRRSSTLLGGECSLEELLLPTFIWQRYPQLIAHSSPPLVFRVWSPLAPIIQKAKHTSLGPLSALDQLAAYMALRPTEFPNVFGVKAPRHEYPQLELAVRQTLRCAAMRRRGDRVSCLEQIERAAQHP